MYTSVVVHCYNINIFNVFKEKYFRIESICEFLVQFNHKIKIKYFIRISEITLSNSVKIICIENQNM